MQNYFINREKSKQEQEIRRAKEDAMADKSDKGKGGDKKKKKGKKKK